MRDATYKGYQIRLLSYHIQKPNKWQPCASISWGPRDSDHHRLTRGPMCATQEQADAVARAYAVSWIEEHIKARCSHPVEE
ncbi:hypothetical protein [Candidatus Nitrospira bockiana]